MKYIIFYNITQIPFEMSNNNDDEHDDDDDDEECTCEECKCDDSKCDEKSDEYNIQADNLSPNLINYFHPKLKIQVDTDWKPPNKYGLDNSPIIIPRYYQKGEKILTVDYYFMILDDIRNLRKLNQTQLHFIKTLEDDKKQEIILEFNKLFDIIETLIC